MTMNVKKILKIIGLAVLWLLFPPLFLFFIFRDKKIKKSDKRVWALTLLGHPIILLGFLILAIWAFSLMLYPKTYSVGSMEDDLGIDIPWSYTEVQNEIKYYQRDYTVNVVLQFDDDEINDLIDEIENTPYYNFDQKYKQQYGKEWRSNKKILNKLIEYLEDEQITGYWIKKNETTYVFVEPNLGDIPNSAILFGHAYIVDAVLNVNQKRLIFTYTKL